MEILSSPDYVVVIGPLSQVRVTGRSREFSLESGVRVGRREIERRFAEHFHPVLADLVDVATAVYAADRLCRRRPTSPNRYDHYWHRRLNLTIPVRRPDVWTDPEVGIRLREALAYATEDTWEFEFVERPVYGTIVQGTLFDRQPRPPVTVALFSGGLDSFAGLCQDLLDRPEHAFVLFSAWTNPRLVARQRDLGLAVIDHIDRTVEHILVPLGIRHENHDYNDDEKTQRTRGFVFACLGAAVALSAGADELSCYENGVGAFNLPLTSAQLGAQNSRSAHPVALHEIASLVSLATEREFSIRLPFVDRTKGELCRAIATVGLQRSITLTVSCDSFPRRTDGAQQCGACTSCLLRRQALGASALENYDPQSEYVHDVHDIPAWRTDRDDVTFPLAAMQSQVRQLRRALSDPQPWMGLVTRYPELDQALQALRANGTMPGVSEASVVRLYDRYCREWADFDQGSLMLPGPSTESPS